MNKSTVGVFVVVVLMMLATVGQEVHAVANDIPSELGE